MAENPITANRISGGTLVGLRFGKNHTDGTLKQCDTAGERADGVINFASSVSSGVPATLNFDGLPLEVTCAGTVTAGEKVQTDANGKAVTQTTGEALGIALTTGTDTTIEIVWLRQAAGHSVIAIPIVLATVANGDIATNWTPGFAGTIQRVAFLVTTAVTTGSKLATLNLEIGTTNLTGGAIALTSANCTPLGAVVAGSAITAANRFTATDTISVEAASVTAFSEGAGLLLVTIATP